MWAAYRWRSCATGWRSGRRRRGSCGPARARRAEFRHRSCFLPAGAGMDPATERLALWRRAGSTRLRGDGRALLTAELGQDAAAGLAAALGGGRGGRG